MRLRNRRTADQPVDADGTARCSRCGTAVPVRPDGTCDLGHRVTSPELAASAASAASAPVEPVPPPLDEPSDVAAAEGHADDKSVPAQPEPTTDDLVADAFGDLTFSRPAPPVARPDPGEGPPGADQTVRGPGAPGTAGANPAPTAPSLAHPAPAPPPADPAPAPPPPRPAPAASDFDRYDLGIGSLSAELADAADEVRAADRDLPTNGAGPHDPPKPPPDDLGPAEDRPAARSIHEPATEPAAEAVGDLARPTADWEPLGQRTAVALEELLDFGAGAPPSALDDDGPSA